MRVYNHLPTVLTVQMAARGLSTRDLSCQTGIDLSTVRRLLNGRYQSTSVRNLAALARLFDCPLASFLDQIT